MLWDYRSSYLGEQGKMFQKQAALKRAARERIAKAIQSNEAIQHKKREDFWMKEKLNAQRQKERLAAEKELQKIF